MIEIDPTKLKTFDVSEFARRCANAGPPEKLADRRVGWWWYREIKNVLQLRPIIAKAYAEHSTADLNRILS